MNAGLLLIVLAFAFLWLVVMRPQKRRRMEQQQMLASLHVGDEILTAGGIYGHITGLREDEVTLEIAPQLEVRVARRAIAGVIGSDGDPPEELDEVEAPDWRDEPDDPSAESPAVPPPAQ